MNERIKELIQMADLCAAGLMASGASEEEIQNRSKVVLAGLIVRECAGIIESQDVDPAFRHRMSWAMKEKFGVEE